MIQLKYLEMCKQITWGMRVRNIYWEPTTSLTQGQMLVTSPNAIIKKALGTHPAPKSFKGLQIEGTGSAPQINEHVHNSMVCKGMGAVEKTQTHPVTGLCANDHGLCQKHSPMYTYRDRSYKAHSPPRYEEEHWGKKWKEHLLSDRGPTLFIVSDSTRIHLSLSPLCKRASLNFFYVFHF